MQKELKDKWIAALRSGEYKQAKSALMLEDGSSCCLGVLCRIMELPQRMTEDKSRFQFEYEGIWDSSMFTDHYARKLGLFDDGNNTIDGTLMGMNDTQGKTFPEIADWIEVNIPND